MKKKAYGKINLSLRVYDKREDGYHNIESLITLVDIYDEMKFKKAAETKVFVKKAKIKNNIVNKTIELIREKYNLSESVEVKIKKRIPIGAGLGGGSSNAACTINAMDELYDLKMTSGEKRELATKLGMDVAFFLENDTCLVSERGEVTNPTINPYIGYYCLLLFSDFSVSTREIYEAYVVPAVHLENDLEASYEATNTLLYREIQNIKKDLVALKASKALMSGSGPTVYGLFEKKKDAKKARRLLKKKYHRTPLITKIIKNN
ncbi:MAG TPA: 4-(cytidine 5'-diphospho)-2-C-methyl-D-erythritol kinase [Acholeplasma sp.]|jgi:4-diphosphocytidyl-2-C-methyl-D-erythritol kinase|nr:4-(cytidine 5'-diphospho)-2-C-methyl-D-erythritol kinase [Acholeplasma sp.]